MPRAVSVSIAVVILVVCLEQHYAVRLRVAKQSYGVVGGLLKVTETDDVAEGLDGVEYAVSATVCLHQSVHLQVLVHPKRVERLGVKARKEHVDHYQQVQLTVLHPLAHVLVVALETLAAKVIAASELPVVVVHRLLQCVLVCL